MSRRKSGFTLLEMMLSLVIMTLVSIAAWQILQSVTKAGKVQGEHLQRQEALDYAFLLLKQDITQLVSRGVRLDGSVSKQSIFTGSVLDSDDDGIMFVRTGWLNAGQRLPRSELQRVYYRLKDGDFQRGYDQVLDKPTLSEPEFRSLLSGISELKFRFYYQPKNNQQGRWFDQQQDDQWPLAIGVSLTLENVGVIERRLLTPQQWEVINDGST